MPMDFDVKTEEIVNQLWADTFEKDKLRKLIRSFVVDAYMEGRKDAHGMHLMKGPVAVIDPKNLIA